MKDIISHDPDFKPTGRNRTVQNVLDQIDRHNYDSRISNEKTLIQKPNPNSIIKLACAMCSGELKRKTVGHRIEGVNVEIPKHVCKTCGSYWIGYGTHLHHIDNANLKCLVVEWNPYNASY